MIRRIFLFVVAAAMLSGIAAKASAVAWERTDFRDETIYFAMTTRFYDGDPKNNVCGWDRQNVQIANNDPDWRGDFKGLIEKLDYIKALGFTAIWITPVVQNASGTDFHGYHAMDMSSVDLRYESHKEWGSEEDVTFQSLIDAAHAKGMKIVLDIVLNHTGNFGEANLNPLFTRSRNIKDQASISAAIIPNYDRLPSNYNELSGTQQYQERFKYFKNPQYDVHNYYHHYGTGWNWDYPSRWWGQIAGDCVDLNTENDAVAEYLVQCYGEFIKMGVDGFRIDTTGHIARLTFNKQFIPQLLAIGEQYKGKRLNGCPFFMFGECCARFSEVTYRGQANLSSYFYTWKSPESLLDHYDGSQEYWDTQSLPEGHDSPVGPMELCEQETEFGHTSDNVLMKGGAWHEPDYSEASGFSIIDFPMHYNFNNAAAAVNIAKSGDKYYNDASYNVVYVDSHDYCPGPNDGTRFNGGTQQWAENLSLMFTFRGIPCIYYGSEVEFKKGCKVDAGGTDLPVKQSGRAYFGNYLEGEVAATDFGEYEASGNVALTLNADLAQHIIRLNKIRAAVPALRKGQYTFDGCSASGGYAFKRAWKDSYALVAINGGATFSGVPAGNYVDLVTGASYTPASGKITVAAPAGKGQLRVLVKDWQGGKVGDDGKFIYANSPEAHGGDVTFDDPGTTEYYTADDAVGQPEVKFSPEGGNFTTATITVTATLNDVAVSGWYRIGEGGEKTTFYDTATFTIGENMAYGETVVVLYGAFDASGKEFTGKVTYKKVDPNATITVYVKSPIQPYLYAWSTATGSLEKLTGDWPGVRLTDKTIVGGEEFYYHTFSDVSIINIIFHNGSGAQTSDITGITGDVYYEYDGLRQANLSGVEEVTVTESRTLEVYTIDGRAIRSVESLSELQRGVYIVNRRKVVIL
ncbi:MAG: alpha-amylase family glycosyl hydrolase [Muribaculaceae bacterium]